MHKFYVNMFKCMLQTNMKQQINITSQESQLAGGKPVGYLQSMEELRSGLQKTNPSSGSFKEDLNRGPSDCKCRTFRLDSENSHKEAIFTRILQDP